MRQAKRQLAGSGEALPVGVIGQWLTATLATDKALTASNAMASLATVTIPPGVWVLNPVATSVWGTVRPAITRFSMRASKSAGTGSVNGMSGNGNFFVNELAWPTTLDVYRIDLVCTPLYVTSDGTVQITFDYLLNGTTAGNNQFSYQLLRIA